MLTGIFCFAGLCAAAAIGWVAACEWYDRHPAAVYTPSRAYADDFAEHLSGRVYDQERVAAPQQNRPIAYRWDGYRDAS